MDLNSREKRSSILPHDRFSDLPDSIIHHIFSFLDANDMVRWRILSKRFEQLCISSPYLSFRGIYDDKRGIRCTKNCKGFSKNMYNIMRLRDGAKIHCLDLRWTCNESEMREAILNTWIHDAVKCQVEVFHLGIDLKLVDNKAYVLPKCIFECPSLRDFELNLSNRNCSSIRPRNISYLKLPCMDFRVLQVLSLNCFKIKDDDLGTWLSTHCKTVKKLSLRCIVGLKKLSIKSSSLEDLSIDFCFFDLEYLTISTEKLHTLSVDNSDIIQSAKIIPMDISARNLRHFTWKGKVVGRIVRNFVEIQTASIYSIQSNYIEHHNGDLVLGTLQALCQCRVLHLHISVLEQLYMDDHLPIFFGNVQEFVIEVRCIEDYQIPVLGTFFKGLPNLTTLKIKCKSGMAYNLPNIVIKEEVESKGHNFYIELEQPQTKLFKNLKVVQIEIDRGNHETGFVDFLLKYAKGLEKMSIIYLNSFLAKLSSIGFQPTGRSEVFCLEKKLGVA